MDLNALADFNLVATHGGFGRASRASRRSKATLSRRVSELEEQLGVRLIERSTKGLELTEAGQLLLSRTEGPMSEVAEAFAATAEGTGQVRGLLRVAAPLLFSQLAMGRLCAEFRQLHPAVTLEVVAEDRLVDLVNERFDVAIRPNPRMDSALVGRCFATDRLLVVAPAGPGPNIPTAPATAPATTPSTTPAMAPSTAFPIPAVVSAFSAGDTWTLEDGRVLAPQVVLRLSSILMVRDAVLAGAGVAMLPESAVAQSLARGELVSWGPVAGREVALWVLHTSRRLASPKVKAFVDFMAGRFPDGRLVLAD
ncbi:LysR family transcriptional regulator [Roseateles depolymerans]|uniref:LysR family transcriptional regulator n=1 Tax=Roseateles depolymerans TaxID=76731 RepID=A0A0U3LQF3_9BURK|nr:LysR family transcriptional regulator [Roseateles depolymerans]ALV08674.1 LysR family transcriptional regulator [Roseateles depolymerans]REG21100.1 transcriptional regulator /LysR family transcriptional regulator [Roseateles depolymerans]